MSKGLRFVLAAAAALLSIPTTRAAEPEKQVKCQVWVFRVSDECYERLQTMTQSSGECRSDCTACPQSCCEKKCCATKCDGQPCCAQAACSTKQPSALPTTLDARMADRLMGFVRDDSNCRVECL